MSEKVTVKDVYELVNELRKETQLMLDRLENNMKADYVSRAEFLKVVERVNNNTLFRNAIIGSAGSLGILLLIAIIREILKNGVQI